MQLRIPGARSGRKVGSNHSDHRHSGWYVLFEKLVLIIVRLGFANLYSLISEPDVHHVLIILRNANSYRNHINDLRYGSGIKKSTPG